MNFQRIFPLAIVLALCVGCNGLTSWDEANTIGTVDSMDLERFMGPWYVISSIPTALDRGQVNAVETYTLRDDGEIDVHFTYRKYWSRGWQITMRPHGFVVDKQSNSRWGMQFFGLPFSFPYLIIDVDPNYQWCAVGGPNREFLWVMSREPTLSAGTYNAIVDRAAAQGYRVDKLRRVPQIW